MVAGGMLSSAASAQRSAPGSVWLKKRLANAACCAAGTVANNCVKLETAPGVVELRAVRVANAVNSEWFGIVLDVGSLRQSDPYTEIEKLAPYAVSWQLKEKVGYDAKEAPTDLRKVKAIVDRAGYRGFLPIETLGPGDAKTKVAEFLADVRTVFGG